MLALQDLHGVHVSLAMCPDGAFGSGGLLLVAGAVAQNPTPLGALRSVSRSRPFPNRDSVTLEGALFKLLHELDHDCSAMWQQERLPEVR